MNIRGKKGITLISIIITIIILVILSSVTINLTVGQNGLFNKAKQAKEKMQIQTIKEKLELEKADFIIEEKGNAINLKEYIDKLIEKQIITQANVENTEYDNSKLITVDGYVFLLTEENEDIIIEFQGKVGEIIIVDRTKPIVTVESNTANTITVTLTDNSSGIVGYAYSKTNNVPQTFISCDNKKDIKITIENLDENTTYYIWAKDLVGNISEVKTATTSVANYILNSGVKYNTLEQAVANAVAGDTIKLISDYTDTSEVIIDKNLTLNTNGKTLTRTKTIQIKEGITAEIEGEGILTTAEDINIIKNYGTLNISHQGSITKTFENGGAIINNSGTVYKNGTGTIENKGACIKYGNIDILQGKVIATKDSAIYTNSTSRVNIYSNATVQGNYTGIMCAGDSTLNIQGGNITATSAHGIWLSNNAELFMKNGTVTGPSSGIFNDGSGNVNIENSDIKSLKDNAIVGSSKCNGLININGGNIAGNIHAVYLKGNTQLKIIDGIFTNEDNDNCAFLVDENAYLEINGGQIFGAKEAIYHTSTGDLVMNDGTLEGKTRGITVTSLSTGRIDVNGGIIHAEEAGIAMQSSGRLEVNGGGIHSEDIGIIMQSSGRLNIDEGNIIGKNTAIYVQGQSNISISGGTLVANNLDGIYVESAGELNIGDAKITGKRNAIFIQEKQENIRIAGATLVGETENGIFVGSSGAAPVVIENGTITGEKYGLYILGGEVQYLGGTLRGRTAGYKGNIDTGTLKPNNVLKDGYYVTTLTR